MVAIRREDAERLGYDTAESWRALVCACLPEIARGYKIPLDHLRWYAAFHRKEHSAHIHLVLFSTDPKEGYLTKHGIEQVKSAFGRRIFEQDLLHVYEQKTEYRNTLGRDAEQAMAELTADLEHGHCENKVLERLVVELADRLQNTTGKKVYGYLPPKTKAVVDAIVDELAKDERVATAYDLWNQMREEVCRTYTEHPPQRVPLSRQKEFKSVRNMVIREVLQLCRDEPSQHSAPQHTSKRQPLTRPQVAGCVLSLFHNMGRIFREQSADDAVQQGLHIDRKRRRMLQEKRMALGHKADDHEDTMRLKQL